jgi:uncharacterized protein (TIGR00297 family)
MRYMRFPAARTRAYKAESAIPNQHPAPRKRTSPAANAVALLCAAGLLTAGVWVHRAALFHSLRHFCAILGITLAFTLAARLMRGVNRSGAFAGAMVAFIVAGRDLRLFWMLLVVFFVTFAATRAGASRKRRLRMAEAESGRSASQVISNLGVAALAVALAPFNSAYLLALAALAELAADTTSSEIGAAFATRTVLITTRKSVPPGTDGGISPNGTIAGIGAAAVTAACAMAFGLVPGLGALVIACSGITGMFVDSLLGATLENGGYLNNDLVNLLSTTAAACLAWAIHSLI